MSVINATPGIILDLCDRLNTLLVGRSPATSATSPGADAEPPAVSVRRKSLDNAVDEARERVNAVKGAMEACAARWIQRNRPAGLCSRAE